MIDAYVYAYILQAGGKKVTFGELTKHLTSRIKTQDLDHPQQLKRKKAVRVIGEMIASGELHIDDDGRVFIQ